ncbi:MAG: hypothetical protein J7J52_04760 [Deltaproteobacteria bacterium]|nr:hypothetical protein [Deltaproteobacteria bacterium]
MRKETVDVKSKGSVLGTIEVSVYESLDEAANAIGEDKALAHINRQVRADAMNAFRAAHTREKSPVARLMAAAKADPSIKEKIEELLASIT